MQAPAPSWTAPMAREIKDFQLLRKSDFEVANAILEKLEPRLVHWNVLKFSNKKDALLCRRALLSLWSKLLDNFTWLDGAPSAARQLEKRTLDFMCALMERPEFDLHQRLGPYILSDQYNSPNAPFALVPPAELDIVQHYINNLARTQQFCLNKLKHLADNRVYQTHAPIGWKRFCVRVLTLCYYRLPSLQPLILKAAYSATRIGEVCDPQALLARHASLANQSLVSQPTSPYGRRISVGRQHHFPSSQKPALSNSSSAPLSIHSVDISFAQGSASSAPAQPDALGVCKGRFLFPFLPWQRVVIERHREWQQSMRPERIDPNRPSRSSARGALEALGKSFRNLRKSSGGDVFPPPNLTGSKSTKSSKDPSGVEMVATSLLHGSHTSSMPPSPVGSAIPTASSIPNSISPTVTARSTSHNVNPALDLLPDDAAKDHPDESEGDGGSLSIQPDLPLLESKEPELDLDSDFSYHSSASTLASSSSSTSPSTSSNSAPSSSSGPFVPLNSAPPSPQQTSLNEGFDLGLGDEEHPTGPVKIPVHMPSQVLDIVRWCWVEADAGTLSWCREMPALLQECFSEPRFYFEFVLGCLSHAQRIFCSQAPPPVRQKSHKDTSASSSSSPSPSPLPASPSPSPGSPAFPPFSDSASGPPNPADVAASAPWHILPGYTKLTESFLIVMMMRMLGPPSYLQSPEQNMLDVANGTGLLGSCLSPPLSSSPSALASAALGSDASSVTFAQRVPTIMRKCQSALLANRQLLPFLVHVDLASTRMHDTDGMQNLYMDLSGWFNIYTKHLDPFADPPMSLRMLSAAVNPNRSRKLLASIYRKPTPKPLIDDAWWHSGEAAPPMSASTSNANAKANVLKTPSGATIKKLDKPLVLDQASTFQLLEHALRVSLHSQHHLILSAVLNFIYENISSFGQLRLTFLRYVFLKPKLFFALSTHWNFQVRRQYWFVLVYHLGLMPSDPQRFDAEFSMLARIEKYQQIKAAREARKAPRPSLARSLSLQSLRRVSRSYNPSTPPASASRRASLTLQQSRQLPRLDEHESDDGKSLTPPGALPLLSPASSSSSSLSSSSSSSSSASSLVVSPSPLLSSPASSPPPSSPSPFSPPPSSPLPLQDETSGGCLAGCFNLFRRKRRPEAAASVSEVVDSRLPLDAQGQIAVDYWIMVLQPNEEVSDHLSRLVSTLRSPNPPPQASPIYLKRALSEFDLICEQYLALQEANKHQISFNEQVTPGSIPMESYGGEMSGGGAVNAGAQQDRQQLIDKYNTDLKLAVAALPRISSSVSAPEFSDLKLPITRPRPHSTTSSLPSNSSPFNNSSLPLSSSSSLFPSPASEPLAVIQEGKLSGKKLRAGGSLRSRATRHNNNPNIRTPLTSSSVTSSPGRRLSL